jgi:hypothetical protein
VKGSGTQLGSRVWLPLLKASQREASFYDFDEFQRLVGHAGDQAPSSRPEVVCISPLAESRN